MHRVPRVQRENDGRDSRVRTREAENRRTENRTANRSPIPKSADSQAGSVVSEPPNCSDAFSRGSFSFYNAPANTRLATSSLTHASPLKCHENSIRPEIESDRFAEFTRPTLRERG